LKLEVSPPGNQKGPYNVYEEIIMMEEVNMSRNHLILASLALILILATACTSPQSATLASADNGSKVVVRVGGQIIIKLNGNPSTGYTWEATDLDATMFKQAGDPVFSSSNPGLVGSGGTLTLTFTTLKAGTSTLTLAYHRPWETGVAPTNTYSVSVTVK
jgi:inhibitor of cysteine peptidase